MGDQEELDRIVESLGRQIPELRERLKKAKSLVSHIRVASPRSDGSATYMIHGSKGDPYEVEVLASNQTRCTCPDGRRGLVSHCKHQLAVLIWRAIPGLHTIDPGDFEKDIRRWLVAPKENTYWDGEQETYQPSKEGEWLASNGRFAIQTLVDEVDRLRGLLKVRKSRRTEP